MYDSVISITWTGGGLEKPQNWRREEEEEESMLTDVKTREAMDKESGSSSPNLGGKEGATLKPTWMGDGQGKKSGSSSPNLRRKRECERLRCACLDVESRGACGSGGCEVLKSPPRLSGVQMQCFPTRPLGSFASTWHIQALPDGNSMSARK
jgi:hypothetical protein